MTFLEAVAAMKKGRRVRRESWKRAPRRWIRKDRGDVGLLEDHPPYVCHHCGEADQIPPMAYFMVPDIEATDWVAEEEK